MSEIIRDATRNFADGQDVDEASAEALLDEMIATNDDFALTELFRAWNVKGIHADEIYHFALILRGRCVRVYSKHKNTVDIVGTGGSSAKTFNVSTAAAFVVGGAGVPVAKHGNRAATSNSGSADVLTELGIKPDVEPETAERCLNEIGICFMFAPKHHGLSPTLARVRRSLGFPTVFNCVGPLCNPAGVPHQVIGVWNSELVPKIADALSRLDTRRSWVVNGHDKLDEISVTGHTTVADVTEGTISTFEVKANELRLGEFSGDLPTSCSPKESAEVIRAILENRMQDRDAEKLVLLNSAAAIYVAGQEESLLSAYSKACESVRSGAAARKLKELAQLTR